MNKERLKKGYKRNQKLDVVLNIRVTKKMMKFIKDNDYSASLIFREALKDLGFE